MDSDVLAEKSRDVHRAITEKIVEAIKCGPGPMKCRGIGPGTESAGH